MDKTKSKLKGSKGIKIKLLSFGALLFACGLVTSAVATTAWYNLIDIAIVSNLNLQIDMSDAILQLGLVQKSSGETIWIDENHPDGFTKEELEIEDVVLTDVSGMFESDWLNSDTDLSTAFPKFHTRYRPGLTTTNPGFISEEEVKKNIVQEEFIFYSENYDMDIYLDEITSFKANSEMNIEAAKKKADNPNDMNEVNQIKNKLDRVIYATRMSFLSDEGYIIINPYKGEDVINNEIETYYGGILDLNKDGFYDYKDEKEILYGEFDGEIPYSGYGDSEDDYKKDVKKYNTFEGEHKLDISKVDETIAKSKIAKEYSENLAYYTYDSKDPLKDTPICHVKKGEQKRIVMSIYVEGWDRHMTDDIASASFDVNIAFTGLVKD